jgi:hypothetical protein
VQDAPPPVSEGAGEGSPESDAAGSAALQGLERGLERVDNRIRRWSTTRWRASGRSGRVREEVAYELAVTLADLARRAGNGAPPIAPPLLAAHAIADQLAVLGAELLGAPEAAAYAEEATAAIERANGLL